MSNPFSEWPPDQNLAQNLQFTRVLVRSTHGEVTRFASPHDGGQAGHKASIAHIGGLLPSAGQCPEGLATTRHPRLKARKCVWSQFLRG